jgi:NAD(P)-dependent dehydrogenase (short-subunit alcohol dehydrogenase family)
VGELRFDGRVAIVTGAGGNPSLGRSYAHLLASRGARVVVNDLGVGPDGRGILRADAARVVEEIRAAGGEAVSDESSVAEEDSARAIVQAALDRWGRVDIVINNAGVVIMGGFDEISAADIDRMVAVHMLGTIWMCRAAWPHMVEQGYGRIVNTSSSSLFGARATAIYGAQKGGIFSLTRGIAAAGAEHGIKVNSVAPGAGTVAVSYSNEDSDWVRQTMARQTPELAAPAVAFLAHEECPVSGRCLSSSGGHVAEVFVDETAGYTNAELTVEDVRDNFEQVLAGGTGAARIGDPLVRDAQARARFTPKPYQPG